MKEIKMNKTILSLVILFVGLGFAGCSSNKSGSASLSSKLSGNTFRAEGVDEILSLVSDCNGDVTESVPAMGTGEDNDMESEPAMEDIEADSNTGSDEPAYSDTNVEVGSDGYASAGEVQQTPDSIGPGVGEVPNSEGSAIAISAVQKAGNNDDYEATFDSTLFVLKNGDQTILSGTWKSIDGNTIEVTTDGGTISLDVEVSGDVLTVSLTAGTSLNCTGGVSGGSTAPGISAPDLNEEYEYEDETDPVQEGYSADSAESDTTSGESLAISGPSEEPTSGAITLPQN